MKRFVQGDNRTQTILLPGALDDYVTDTNPVRVVDVFVDELDLQKLGFEGVEPALTGRPSYHPEVMLKIYIYGYLNRIQSSRRLEREAQRNVELMWLTGLHDSRGGSDGEKQCRLFYYASSHTMFSDGKRFRKIQPD